MPERRAAVFKVKAERKGFAPGGKRVHPPNEGAILERLDQNIEAAAAGQANVEVGRAFAIADDPVPAGLDDLHGLKRNRAFEASTGDVTSPTARFGDGHLRALGSWSISIDAD